MKNINRDEWHFPSKGDFPAENLDSSFIVCSEKGEMDFAWFDENHNTFEGSYLLPKEVIAWRYPPLPPEEDEMEADDD